MISLSELEKRLAGLPEEHIGIILQIRDIVAGLVPGAVERLDRKGISYYDTEKGGPVKAGICQILFEPDPAPVLIGGAQYKRFAIFKNCDEVSRNQLQELITVSAQFDPMKLVV